MKSREQVAGLLEQAYETDVVDVSACVLTLRLRLSPHSDQTVDVKISAEAGDDGDPILEIDEVRA